MKQTLTITLSIVISAFFSLSGFTQKSMSGDSIIMSAGYVNEVYYSMEDGAVQTSPRATWDISFRTMKMSSSILTNDGAGVVLYTYPKSDTAGWASVDTSGLFSWTPMYNDPADWENGAFSRNAKGHPDYGWGIYNDVTHNLTGDSLYIIKLRDGSFRKLWIVKKLSSADQYVFRYAKLDGSDEHAVTEDLNDITSAEFSGYSLETNARVVYEPAKESWDLLFTRYMSVQPNGTPYPVVGVLSNDHLYVKKFRPVSLEYSDFLPGEWDSTRSSIGWDWKKYNATAGTYEIVDSTVYFVRNEYGHVYKLYFTEFAGSTTGLVKFSREQLTGLGLLAVDQSVPYLVYPNPAKDRITLYFAGEPGKDALITFADLSGRQLRADRPVNRAEGPFAHTMDMTGVQPGIYFVTVSDAARRTVTRVIITR